MSELGQIERLIEQQIETARTEAEAKLRAAQEAAALREVREQHLSATNRLIAQIEELLTRTEPLGNLGQQMQALLSTMQALVSVVAGMTGITRRQAAELQDRMHELALAGIQRHSIEFEHSQIVGDVAQKVSK